MTNMQVLSEFASLEFTSNYSMIDYAVEEYEHHVKNGETSRMSFVIAKHNCYMEGICLEA